MLGVICEEAPESMIHSPVEGELTVMVLKALASACWSQETPAQGVHGDGVEGGWTVGALRAGGGRSGCCKGTRG